MCHAARGINAAYFAVKQLEVRAVAREIVER